MEPAVFKLLVQHTLLGLVAAILTGHLKTVNSVTSYLAEMHIRRPHDALPLVAIFCDAAMLYGGDILENLTTQLLSFE